MTEQVCGASSQLRGGWKIVDCSKRIPVEQAGKNEEDSPYEMRCSRSENSVPIKTTERKIQAMAFEFCPVCGGEDPKGKCKLRFVKKHSPSNEVGNVVLGSMLKNIGN